MIISASYRTDIPAFYGRWFLNRLAAGGVRVASPYGGPPAWVSLNPADVAGYVFWTRNPAPFTDALAAVAAQDRPFTVQLTVTGYPRALDGTTPAPDRALAAARAIRRRYGPHALVWRYDPVVFTTATDAAWHRAAFTRLADAFMGLTDACVLSVAQIYAKTRRGLDRMAATGGPTWWDPPDDEKRALLADLAGLARERGLTPSLCGQRDLLVEGMDDARCVDPDRLARVAGRPLVLTGKGHREGCGCAPSRDIGAYDSCPHGCVYCYAVRSRDGARRRHARHDPAGEMLIPPILA